MKTRRSIHQNLEGGEFARIPSCQGCGSKAGVKPSFHSYKGAYFCIECCNYLDEQGLLSIS